jgi:hypothetical protein
MIEVTKFIENLLNEVCLDDRIPSGVFDINKSEHRGILKECAANMVNDEFATELSEVLQSLEEKGNFPERQAYNKDGILVTFPDKESKDAAIARGSHQDSPPIGTQTTDDTSDTGSDASPVDSTSNTDSDSEASPDDADDAPEDKEDDIFAPDYEAPEELVVGDEEPSILDREVDASDITLRFDGEPPSHEVIHVYDILDKIKTSQESDEIPDLSFDEAVESGELDPTILFALKQKWEYDKGGRWYDENNKLRAATDRAGKLDPAKSKDRDEMLMWLEDYLKKKKSSSKK